MSKNNMVESVAKLKNVLPVNPRTRMLKFNGSGK
tara:strand:- start:332 stop:433 length:102 start_codon:yes stop_codon:yes gene_type:complete